MAIKECVERLKPLIIALEKTEDAINTTETRGNPIYAVNDIKMASRAIDLATRIKDGIPEEELSEIKKHLLEAREAAYAKKAPSALGALGKLKDAILEKILEKYHECASR